METVGSAGFTSIDSRYISLVLDSNNVPYVGYEEYDTTVPPIGKDLKATVMYFE